MILLYCLSALFFFLHLVGASLVGSDSWRRSLETLSERAKSKSSPAKATTGRRVSTIVVVIVIIVIVAILIGLAVIVFLCRRRANKRANKQALGMGYIKASTGQPATGARREGDWWQPPNDTIRNSTIANNSNSSYSQGGQGYTYGLTPEQHHRSNSGRFSPDTRTVADTQTSVHHGGLPQDEPFQIPVAPFSRPPGRPTSISPSYHTEAAGGDLSVESGGPAQHPRTYLPPSNPPSTFQTRQPIQPLQPQSTGTSIYTSPYGGMTHSTSGHPGE